MTLECHAIDMSNGRANIAYIGKKPWHGLGDELDSGATIEQWKKSSGLDFAVKEAGVRFVDNEDPTGEALGFMNDRKVLFRSDTRKPLAVVGSKYKPVQPGEVLEFFRNLTEENGFQLETAGSLHGGRRVWALAKYNDGQDVIAGDRVLPYLLLATSFDGGLATTAKFTAIRVVCHNTITMAMRGDTAENKTVKTRHNSVFNAADVQKSLGLVQSTWSEWLNGARKMATLELSPEQVAELTAQIALRTIPKGNDPKDSKAFASIMGLFNGAAIGSDLTGGATGWQFVNSVTEYIDHQRGRAADSRMNRAWFGDGDAIKSQAFELVTELMA